MAPVATINVTAASAEVDDGVIGGALMQLGFKPNAEFVTIFNLKPLKYQIQLRSEEIAERVVAKLDAQEALKSLFTVHKPTRSILVTRVFGTVTNKELENALFPPRIRSSIKVLSTRIEQKKTKEGYNLWYTGRRFLTISENDFQRNKHILPSHIVIDGHTSFVKFDGSKQACFSCGSTEHLVKECKSPAMASTAPSTSAPLQENPTLQQFMNSTTTSNIQVPPRQSRDLRVPSYNTTLTENGKKRNRSKSSTRDNTIEKKREENENQSEEINLDTTAPNEWTTIQNRHRRKTVSKERQEIPTPAFIRRAYKDTNFAETITINQLRKITTALEKSPFFDKASEDFFVYTSDEDAEQYN